MKIATFTGGSKKATGIPGPRGPRGIDGADGLSLTSTTFVGNNDGTIDITFNYSDSSTEGPHRVSLNSDFLNLSEVISDAATLKNLITLGPIDQKSLTNSTLGIADILQKYNLTNVQQLKVHPTNANILCHETSLGLYQIHGLLTDSPFIRFIPNAAQLLQICTMYASLVPGAAGYNMGSLSIPFANIFGTNIKIFTLTVDEDLNCGSLIPHTNMVFSLGTSIKQFSNVYTTNIYADNLRNSAGTKLLVLPATAVSDGMSLTGNTNGTTQYDFPAARYLYDQGGPVEILPSNGVGCLQYMGNNTQVKFKPISVITVDVTTRSILPLSTNTYNLGSFALRFNNAYMSNLNTTTIRNFDSTVTLILPTTQPASNGLFLSGNTDGTTSWATAGGGAITSIPNTLTLRDVLPETNITYSIGSAAARFDKIYSSNIHTTSVKSPDGLLTFNLPTVMPASDGLVLSGNINGTTSWIAGGGVNAPAKYIDDGGAVEIIPGNGTGVLQYKDNGYQLHFAPLTLFTADITTSSILVTVGNIHNIGSGGARFNNAYISNIYTTVVRSYDGELAFVFPTAMPASDNMALIGNTNGTTAWVPAETARYIFDNRSVEILESNQIGFLQYVGPDQVRFDPITTLSVDVTTHSILPVGSNIYNIGDFTARYNNIYTSNLHTTIIRNFDASVTLILPPTQPAFDNHVLTGNTNGTTSWVTPPPSVSVYNGFGNPVLPIIVSLGTTGALQLIAGGNACRFQPISLLDVNVTTHALMPYQNNTQNIGTPSLRYGSIFVNDVYTTTFRSNDDVLSLVLPGTMPTADGNLLAGNINGATLWRPSVLSTVITGYVETPGTVEATDTVLQAFNKLGSYFHKSGGFLTGSIYPNIALGYNVGLPTNLWANIYTVNIRCYDISSVLANGEVTCTTLIPLNNTYQCGTAVSPWGSVAATTVIALTIRNVVANETTTVLDPMVTRDNFYITELRPASYLDNGNTAINDIGTPITNGGFFKDAYIKNGVTTISDISLKKDITALDACCVDLLLSMNTISYHWLDEAITDKYTVGFDATQIETLINASNLCEWGIIKRSIDPVTNLPGFASINMHQLIPVVVKTLQTQHATITSQATTIATMQTAIDTQATTIASMQATIDAQAVTIAGILATLAAMV